MTTTTHPEGLPVSDDTTTPTLWRRKPIVVEARQWTGENTNDVYGWLSASGAYEHISTSSAGGVLVIHTGNGDLIVDPGIWIVKGGRGELYFCKPDVFAEDHELVEPEPEPEWQMPDGEFARVEILGHDQHTGWVTESTRAGQPVMVIRGWNGHVVAEIPGHTMYRFVPLPTPLKRPDLEPPRAIQGGWYGMDGDDEDYDNQMPAL